MKTLLHVAILGLAALLLAGCDQSAKPAAVTPTGGSTAGPAGLEGAPAENGASTIQVKAGVGSGKKGRSLDKHEGIIVTPAKTLFAVKERIVFDFQVQPALDRFNAYEGRFPTTHEEFMVKIVGENQIKLPELPEGHKYVYDPSSHELMVEKPAQ